MDKFAIDLDSILDQLEENDDDTDRGHPPSLVKIANCNTFANNNDFPSIDSYRKDIDLSTEQSSNDTFGCSTSSMSTNSYKRHLFSYSTKALEKLDTSEAEFGISIKPIETQMIDNKDLNNAKTTYDLNESQEKNRLIASLLEKAKWNTEDMKNDRQDYDMDTNSSDEDVSDEVLYVAIDHNGDQNKDSDDGKELSSDGQQIQIKLLSTMAKEMEFNDITIDSTNDSQNNVSELTENENKNDINSVVIEENVSENDLKITVSNVCLQSEECLPLNEEVFDEINQISQTDCQLIPTAETNISEELVINENKWETDSIKNNFDITSNVVKFSEIEVNINDLTEHEINEYLSEFETSLREDNAVNDLVIKPNINIEDIIDKSCCDSTNNDLLTTTSDKDVNSMSLSASSVSIEDNDKISDISELNEVCNQSNISHNSEKSLENDIHFEIESQFMAPIEDKVNRISRPNTLSIPSNAVYDAIDGNIVDINEDNFVDNIDSESNDVHINGSDNYVPNDEEFRQPMDSYSEPNLTLGLTEDEQMLGKVKPFWIPDNETQICMHCDIKFTLIKRRHHCRACGKVLCAQCCNSRAKLVYLDNEVSRVCQICYSTLARIAAIERNANDSNHSSPSNLGPDSQYPDSASGRSPDPNNPLEYCSTVPPFEQEQDIMNRPPPTVMVPVGVLKRGDRPKGEPKQVVFSDGIRPGGDLTETTQSSSNMSFMRRTGRIQHKLKSPPVENITALQSIRNPKSKASRIVITDSNGSLPPIINYYDLNCNKTIKTKPSIGSVIELMKSKDLSPLVFALTKNLHIFVKIVFKDCCVQTECWTFATKGMATIGQDEILVTLERLPEEDSFPRDIFRLFTFIYDSASKGTVFNDMSHVFFPDGLFGSKDNSGFLFMRPTLQCFNNLVLPSPPFLLAILILKWEIPWAKVFPLRLLLRLGAEYKYYPSPIVSYRCRKPVYCEIGHTIMNVLADFRNFQYTLPTVPGLTIHLETKKITVQLPRNRYEKVQKVLVNSNEHVLAFGANFSLKADSHLITTQNDVDGQYQTQTINIEGAVRKITGASFIVFSGALKSSTGLTAKMSIVEDGLLVQIPPHIMTQMRSSLKDMKNYSIDCGKVDSEPEEVIELFWGEEDLNVNLGVRSPIDGTNLEGIQSIRIYNGTDYTNDKLVIRWTEVFFLQINELSRRSESIDPSRLAEMIAQSFCLALTSCLDQLFDNGFTKIGLRINLDSDKVGYEVGSDGSALPTQYTAELDGALIPVIMENTSSGVEDQLIIELLFYILVK